MKINELITQAHENAVFHGFWEAEDTILAFMKRQGFIHEYADVQNAFQAQKIMLIVTELAEAIEAIRSGDRQNFEEELADTVIRIADFCGGYGIDLESAIKKKMEINKNRPKLHGKKY